MTFLPNELLLQITRCLDPCEPDENRVLQSLRTVCKFTSQIASEMLFKTVVMAGPLEHMERLVDTLVEGDVMKYTFRVLLCVSSMVPERKLEIMKTRARKNNNGTLSGTMSAKRAAVEPSFFELERFTYLLRRFFSARAKNSSLSLVDMSLLLTSDLEEFPDDRRPWDDEYSTIVPSVLNDFMIAQVTSPTLGSSTDEGSALLRKWTPFVATEKVPNPLVMSELRLHAEHSSQLRKYGQHFMTFFAPTLSIFVGSDDADVVPFTPAEEMGKLYTLQHFLDDISVTPCPFRNVLTLFGGYSTTPISFLKPTEFDSRLTILKLQGITPLRKTLLRYLSSTTSLRNVHLSYVLLDETSVEWSHIFEVLKRSVDAFFFEGLHYQYGDPIYYWGDQAVGGYRWRRPLESHLEDDYTAFTMFRDGVLERRKKCGMEASLYMDKFCCLDICTKRIFGDDDEEHDGLRSVISDDDEDD